MTHISTIWKRLSIEGIPQTRKRLLPLLATERGFQSRTRRGPGYIEWLIRPVRAIIVFGRPRVFLVCGTWTTAAGQHDVPMGADFLDEETETDASYLRFDDPQVDGVDWREAALKPAEPWFQWPDREEDAYELLLHANQLINGVVYDGVLGRESNNWLFPDDYCPLHLIERMITHLDYLREIYTSDRHTIKA